MSGIALSGLGVWFLLDLDAFKSIIEEDPKISNCAYGMIAAGGLLLIIGCIGCIGTLRERRCCLGLVSVKYHSFVPTVDSGYSEPG